MMNPGTALGIAAAQLAQQGQYKPFTSDGKPTVVNNLITQESQKEAAKQAQTAAQIEAMKQAQMQQQLQQMLAQKTAPQAPLASGIGSLGADVQMAEGGVVGYNGQTDSDVKLSVDERLKRAWEDFLKGTYYGSTRNVAPESPQPTPPAPIPEGSDRRTDIPAGGIVSPGVTSSTPMFDTEAIALRQRRGMNRSYAEPRPQAGERKQSAVSTVAADTAATTPTPLPSDTRESTAVNPSQSALQYATEVGRLRELQDRLGRKPEETAQEKAYREATAAGYQRGIGAIDAAQKRYEDMITAQRGRGLADFLASAGGARSLFSGLGQAQLRSSQVEGQQEAAKIAYFDKLDERRNAVENLKLATLKQDAEQARAWSQEVRKIDADITRLMVGLGEKQAGEQARAELSREEMAATARRELEKTAATARENELNRQAQMKLEEYRRQTQLMKPHELQIIDKLEKYKLDELTGGKAGTATPAQQAQALREAIQEARGASKVTDFSRQFDVALQARLARGEPDNAQTREAARQDVIKGTPAAQRADTAKVKEAQAMVERLMLSPEYRKIKDKAEARRLAKAEAAREYKLTPTDIPDSGAAQPTTTAPRGTRDNPIKLD